MLRAQAFEGLFTLVPILLVAVVSILIRARAVRRRKQREEDARDAPARDAPARGAPARGTSVRGTPARARFFHGDYAYYLWRLGEESANADPVDSPVKAAPKTVRVAQKKENQPNHNTMRLEKKALKSDLRRMVRQEAEILKRLDELFPGPGGEAPMAYAW